MKIMGMIMQRKYLFDLKSYEFEVLQSGIRNIDVFDGQPLKPFEKFTSPSGDTYFITCTVSSTLGDKKIFYGEISINNQINYYGVGCLTHDGTFLIGTIDDTEAVVSIDGEKYRGKEFIIKGQSITMDGNALKIEDAPFDPNLAVKGNFTMVAGFDMKNPPKGALAILSLLGIDTEKPSGTIVNSYLGRVSVIINGIETIYNGDNGRLTNSGVYIDQKRVEVNDPRIVCVQRTNYRKLPNVKLNNNQEELEAAPPANTRNKLAIQDAEPQVEMPALSEDALTHEVAEFRTKQTKLESYSQRFSKLPQEEQDKYENYFPDHFDAVSTELINIPVQAVTNAIYDLDTLLSLRLDEYGCRQEPLSRINFKLSDIRIARLPNQQNTVAEQIEKNLVELEKIPAKKIYPGNK